MIQSYEAGQFVANVTVNNLWTKIAFAKKEVFQDSFNSNNPGIFLPFILS